MEEEETTKKRRWRRGGKHRAGGGDVPEVEVPRGLEARQVYPPPIPGQAVPQPPGPEAPAGGETAPRPPGPESPAAREPVPQPPGRGPEEPAGRPPARRPGPEAPPPIEGGGPVEEEERPPLAPGRPGAPTGPGYEAPPAPVIYEQPPAEGIPPQEGSAAPPGPGQEPAYRPPGPADYYGQGYWTPYGWYQPPPPGYGYPPGYPPPGGYGYGIAYPPYPPGQTAPMPPLPPGYPPPTSVLFEGAVPSPEGLRLQMTPEERAEFHELTREQAPLWRLDFKWLFGIVAAAFLFVTLTLAGVYRLTGPGSAKQVLTPLIRSTTYVRQTVKENYQELRRKARKTGGARIAIPDIGMEITIEGEAIKSLGADELADRVIAEVERKIFGQGYEGDLPMRRSVGAGEDRGRAVTATYLSVLNKKTRKSLVVPLAVCGGISLVFAVLFLIFCRGWGKMSGTALVIISGSLPGSLMLRIGNEFLWSSDTGGVYKGAMYQAFRTTAVIMAPYYDIALALGALLLLVGVIAGLIARRTRERVPPFTELRRPEEAVVGGPPLVPGLEPRLEEEEPEPAAPRGLTDEEDVGSASEEPRGEGPEAL